MGSTHGGIFAHHDTKSHAHVIAEEPAKTGHADISAGARMFLPETGSYG